TSAESSPPVAFTTTCVLTSLAYTGDTLRGGGSNLLKVSAQLASPVSACRIGQPIVFSLDRNPTTQGPGPFTLTTLTTNASGQAGPVSILGSAWQAGHYMLTASYAGGTFATVHCAPTTALAQITVLGPPGGGGPPPPITGHVAAGAGSIPANGGTTFGFDLQVHRGGTAVNGQFILLNGRNSRIAGALTSYANVGGVGTATGVGDVYFLNRFRFWQLAAHNVPVVITFTAGGAGTGTVGIQISYSPVPPQPALPNTVRLPLSYGIVQIFH
ncbi:MAG TPA: hypothetical protein VKJ07_15010, partial [Mycobacteriales bacterium]|nr:hypothetical protein [Mycobacteriales bacterium]